MPKTGSISKNVNTDVMCRMCLLQCDAENLLLIFDPNDESLTVRIMACAGLEVF